MRDRQILGLGLNSIEKWDIRSMLGISRMEKIMGNALFITNIGLQYEEMFNHLLPKNIGSLTSIINMEKNYNNSLALYSLERGKLAQNLERSFRLAKAIGFMPNAQIFELSSSIRAWQSSIKLMSNDFVKNYYNIVTRSTKSLSAVMMEMNRNNVSFSSIESFTINEWLPELSNMDTFEFDEKLENEIDLQEVEAIIDSKIEDIRLAVKKEKGDITFILSEMLKVIKENSTKSSLVKDVVSGVLTSIITIILTIIFNSFYPYTPSNEEIKYIVKATKQVVSTMEVDNSFYNTVRIVVKDGLEVRESKSMKSGVKYYLEYGTLVKIEQKNRNWTKISYTNEYTDERETGWVLTRYIKRLD